MRAAQSTRTYSRRGTEVRQMGGRREHSGDLPEQIPLQDSYLRLKSIRTYFNKDRPKLLIQSPQLRFALVRASPVLDQEHC